MLRFAASAMPGVACFGGNAMEDCKQLAFQIKFENVDVAEANRLVEDLRNYVLDAAPSVEAKRQRVDQTSMDCGSLLLVMLSAPAVVAVAKGIGNFLQRYQSASLTIKGPHGSVVVKNVTARQASDLAAKLQDAWAAPR
jgi:hypothetical protein